MRESYIKTLIFIGPPRRLHGHNGCPFAVGEASAVERPSILWLFEAISSEWSSLGPPLNKHRLSDARVCNYGRMKSPEMFVTQLLQLSKHAPSSNHYVRACVLIDGTGADYWNTEQ